MSERTFKHCWHCGRTEGFQVKTVWKTYKFVACQCKAAGPVAKDEDEAVRLWNERVGETCEYTLEYDREEVERRRNAYEENPFGFFPQSMPQTCWTCSACGQQWKTHARWREDGGYELAPLPEWMKCCPNCGARITKAAMP